MRDDPGGVFTFCHPCDDESRAVASSGPWCDDEIVDRIGWLLRLWVLVLWLLLVLVVVVVVVVLVVIAVAPVPVSAFLTLGGVVLVLTLVLVLALLVGYTAGGILVFDIG